MKIPKTIQRYCAHCKKHTAHRVFQSKKKNPSVLKRGSKVRAKRRGRATGHGNLGRYSKPAITKWKMAGKKTTKKTDLRYECQVCKKISAQRKGIRAKRVEFV